MDKIRIGFLYGFGFATAAITVQALAKVIHIITVLVLTNGGQGQ